MAGASLTRAGSAPRARATSAGRAPGTRSVRPASAAGRPAASSASSAAAHDSASTTLTRLPPVISAAVPWATTRPSAMMTSLPHSPASSR